MSKRGRKLNQTMRGVVERRWPIMKWYIQWSDYVRKQHRFRRWLIAVAPGLSVKTAELHEFDRSQWPETYSK